MCVQCHKKRERESTRADTKGGCRRRAATSAAVRGAETPWANISVDINVPIGSVQSVKGILLQPLLLGLWAEEGRGEEME